MWKKIPKLVDTKRLYVIGNFQRYFRDEQLEIQRYRQKSSVVVMCIIIPSGVLLVPTACIWRFE